MLYMGLQCRLTRQSGATVDKYMGTCTLVVDGKQDIVLFSLELRGKSKQFLQTTVVLLNLCGF